MANMEVLLRQDIDNLGERGQIVRVRRGYGRNYLLPHGLAVQATASNLRQIETERSVLAKREARERAAAHEAVKQFEGGQLTFERKIGAEGKLFGSVTVLDIVHALEAEGRSIDRYKIRLKDPIKALGEFEVAIRLHRDVIVPLKVVVKPEGGAAAPAEVRVAAAPAPVIVAPVAHDEDDDEDFEEYEE